MSSGKTDYSEIVINYFKSKLLRLNSISFDSLGLYFEIIVNLRPNSRVESISILPSGEFKIHIRERPIEGKANEALILFLSSFFCMSKSSIEIIRGEKSKVKHVAIRFRPTQNRKIEYYLDYWEKQLKQG